MRVFTVVTTTFVVSTPAYAAYNLVKEYSGQNFFNGWDFYGNYDNLTSGMCHSVTRQGGWSSYGYV